MPLVIETTPFLKMIGLLLYTFFTFMENFLGGYAMIFLTLMVMALIAFIFKVVTDEMSR